MKKEPATKPAPPAEDANPTQGSVLQTREGGGRPTLYREEYAEQARKLCLLMATDVELADFFGVCEKTIYNWQDEHPEFLQAVHAGKIIADTDVAVQLRERALGFRWMKAHPIKLKSVQYENGKRASEEERVEIVMVEEVVPPDTQAAAFWLKNRRGWKDKQEITGTDGGALLIKVVGGE